ncbi:MAG: hypothetical protein ACP5XB_31360, partial [Isosphaeraceae bacterium]
FELGITKKRPPWRISLRWMISEVRCTIESLGLFTRLLTRVSEPELRQEYKKRFWGFLKVHHRPGLMLCYAFHLVMHYHIWRLAKNMATREAQLVNSF